ncbi:MAG: hypothetical protein IT388_00645 [Nitrospirales bacterium]|nr:hypothetical protein [Nitrospirales bacterium]
MLTLMEREAEEGLLPGRRNNHLGIITKLFQQYVDDFGPEAGAQIINAVITHLGGEKITFPDGRTDHWRHFQSAELLRNLYADLCSTFGSSSGEVIMRTMWRELRGERVTFISHGTLRTLERNRAVRRDLREEVSAAVIRERYGIDAATLWRIRQGEEDVQEDSTIFLQKELKTVGKRSGKRFAKKA